MTMNLKIGFLFTCASVFSTLIVAAGTPRATEAAVSTFIYPTDNGNLTFALSAANTGDIYMHFSAPSTYQWAGIGTGSEMDGSVMLILYKNADQNGQFSSCDFYPCKTHLTEGVTLSTRLSDGHFEPRFSNKIDCALDDSASYHSSIDQTGNTQYYSANIRCKNLTAIGKGDGKLDLTNVKQPFLYAWGPAGDSVSSSSKSASIKRHDAYGNFWMDMTKATSPDLDEIAIPTGTALLSNTNAGADGRAESDGDKVGPAHAAIMLAAFLIVFPLGAILLRFLESVKAHYITQTVGVLAALIGVAVGIYLSNMYNHSKDVSSGHQVFGLILLILLFAQWAIGLYHHLRFRKYKISTAYGKVHLFAGPAIVLGGIINGFTGFNFSNEPHNNVYYGIAVAVILSAVLVLLVWKRRSKDKQMKRSRLSHNEEFNYEPPRMELDQRVV